MEINLFSKCIKELFVENDRVEVPYLGVFTATMMPASYSDRQTTILPPYRKMSFHKEDVSLAEGRLLLEKVRKKLGVSLDQAGVELGWCLSRLCSELEGRKSCKLPGLGVMRANARNEFFFVPDDDLDIWPDGIGFEAISIKVSEKAAAAAPAEQAPVEVPAPAEPAAPVEPAEPAEPVVPDAPAAQAPEAPEAPEAKPQRETAYNVLDVVGHQRELVPELAEEEKHMRRPIRPVWIVLIVLGALLLLFVAASYLFTEQLSPILDPLLYTKEELELLGR